MTQPAANPAGSPAIAVQRAKQYGTIAELVADSSLVVYFTATSVHSVADVNGLPFTTTTMTVDRVVRGTVPAGGSILLRQMGPANLEDPVTLVVPGHRYLAFLGLVSFAPGTTTGQWFVVGLMAGLYELSGDQVVRLDSVSTGLPASGATASIDAQIVAAPTFGG